MSFAKKTPEIIAKEKENILMNIDMCNLNPKCKDFVIKQVLGTYEKFKNREYAINSIQGYINVYQANVKEQAEQNEEQEEINNIANSKAKEITKNIIQENNEEHINTQDELLKQIEILKNDKQKLQEKLEKKECKKEKNERLKLEKEPSQFVGIRIPISKLKQIIKWSKIWDMTLAGTIKNMINIYLEENQEELNDTN